MWLIHSKMLVIVTENNIMYLHLQEIMHLKKMSLKVLT